MINQFALGVAVILLTGLLFGKIAKFLRVPNVTGYLIGGLLIGPTLVHLIIPSFAGVVGWDLLKVLSLVAQIELGFIAFTVGSEFKLSYFKQVGIMPLIIAFAESLAAVVFITAGIMLVGLPFGVPFEFALALGAVGGATAPAATIMVIRQYKAKGPLAKTILSVVAIDDASALIFFGIAIAIIKSMTSATESVAMMVAMPFIEIGASLILGLATGLFLTLLMKPFSSKGNRIVSVIAVIFINIGVCIWLNEVFDTSFSSLLACMTAGAIFTNLSKSVEEVIPLIEHVTPPLVVIFFVISGASLEINRISLVGILLLVVYLVFRIAGKVLGTWGGAKIGKAPPVVKKWLGFALLPQGGIAIGLTALVVVALPESEAFPVYNGQLIQAIVLLAVFASEVFGPILCKFALIKSGEAQIEPQRARSKGGSLPPPNVPDEE